MSDVALPGSNDSAKMILTMWLAVPPSAREPATMEALAEQLGVHYTTLWHWRQEPGFADAVWDFMYQWIRSERIAQVIESLFIDATTGPLTSAKVQAARLVLETAGVIGQGVQVRNTQVNVGTDGLLHVVFDSDVEAMIGPVALPPPATEGNENHG